MFLHYLKGSFVTTVVRLLPLQIPVLSGILSEKRKERADIERIFALEAATLLVPSILMLSPEFPKRAAYPSIIYALAAMSASWEFIDFDRLTKRYGKEIKAVKRLGAVYIFLNTLASVMVDRIFADPASPETTFTRR